MPRIYWLALLLTMVISSALSVIYVKHESRILFAELRDTQKNITTRKFQMSWQQQILRVNLSTGDCKIEPLNMDG